MFANLSDARPLIQSGRLKAIAVADTNPLEEVPGRAADLRADTRLHITDLVRDRGPRATSRTIVEQISNDVAAAMKSPSVTGRLKALSLMPVESSPVEASTFVEEDARRWRKVIDLIGLQPE